jgi:tRNA(Ile)-lysidine synthase
VTLTPAAPEGERLQAAFDLVLPVPGRVDVPAANLWLTAAAESGQAVAGSAGGSDTAVLQAATLELPLRVRSRRPGDRLRPLGAPGRRKLQDVLVDRKVPRGERDRVPIVVDARGRIVWVAGLTIADECRVSSPSAGVVILKLHRGT